LLTVKRMFFEDNEIPNSLEVSKEFKSVCLASLRYEETDKDKIRSEEEP
jgi:hypothetical protein